MRSGTSILLSIAIGLLWVGIAGEALARAQRPTYREPVIPVNPQRDAGGSCVYDKQGRVVFAPDGRDCPDATDHLSKAPSGASPIVSAYPPAVRGELAQILGDHEHIAQEVARLRQAVDSQDRNVALAAVNKIRAELTEHRAREEAFLAKMAPNRESP